MDKDKIIEVLKSLPKEFFQNSYIIGVKDENRFNFQMKYNSELAKILKNANRWIHQFDGNGFTEFIRDDNIKIIMT